jgi:hypothetical protein
MAKDSKVKFPESFGVFSPTGHVVMAFASDGQAEQAKQLLLNSGFAADDIAHYKNADVLAELQKSEKQSKSPLQIGQEVEKVDDYLVLAKQGCGFIVLHAPKDEAATRAVALVKPLGLKFAEKYNRLTMEELA